jgi:hypothetical protein
MEGPFLLDQVFCLVKEQWRKEGGYEENMRCTWEMVAEKNLE